MGCMCEYVCRAALQFCFAPFLPSQLSALDVQQFKLRMLSCKQQSREGVHAKGEGGCTSLCRRVVAAADMGGFGLYLGLTRRLHNEMVHDVPFGRIAQSVHLGSLLHGCCINFGPADRMSGTSRVGRSALCAAEQPLLYCRPLIVTVLLNGRFHRRYVSLPGNSRSTVLQPCRLPADQDCAMSRIKASLEDALLVADESGACSGCSHCA
jgi:hypothetical protein